jgi:hypothetical protein
MNTRLVEILASFESRWIPHTNDACPICWEQGLTARFNTIDEFRRHMKDSHHGNLKNIKDYWCAACWKAIGVTIIRKGMPTRQGTTASEMMNGFVRCLHGNCHFSHSKRVGVAKHIEKMHDDPKMPAVGSGLSWYS